MTLQLVLHAMEVRTQHNSFRRVLRPLDPSRMPLLVLIVELELNRRRQGECDLWGKLRPAPVEVSVAPPELQRHRQDSGVANRYCAFCVKQTGKLGHGTDLSNQWEPKKVEALASKRVVAVSAGYCHSLALIADGVVFSWGEGEFGCLGHGTKRNRSRPGKIEALEGQHVIAVSAGRSYSLAVTANGALWSWGDACLGSLGHSDQLNHLLPKKIDALAGHRVVTVSAGIHHNLAADDRLPRTRG